MSCDERLRVLREELARRRLDGFVIAPTDEYLSEYVGAYAKRLAWLTGFTGSGGAAVVLAAQAAIFIDGRYTLQVRQQVDARSWNYQSLPQTSTAAWLGEHAPEGSRIGYDPWLHTKGWFGAARAALRERGAQLVAVETNPIDAVWVDQPSPSAASVIIHPEQVAGKGSIEKRRDVARWLTAKDADVVVLSALDCIAWIFNIRGGDIPRTPVAFAYALVHADSTADLFIAPEKLTDEVIEHLGTAVRLHPREAFVEHLRRLASKKVMVDPELAAAAIFDALEAAGARVIEARDPVMLRKAIKNAAEIAGHKAAQARDGAALTRFLHWFSKEAPQGTLTEKSAADKLLEFREASGELRDLSFDTISAFGPNGAIVHYRPTKESCASIRSRALYLVDSGGQYVDGTTDVTRTVAIGMPTDEMRDRFTRVLKGHIALARAVFPAGTSGRQLDTLARTCLWAAGLDYAHGTGHGVGSYLAVHEGPQRFGTASGAAGGGEEALAPGMILSNEPGYYKRGEYGIRIENLMLVVAREISGAEHEMLGFEMLTFAPLDRTLIDVAMLTAEEREWIDEYHAHAAEVVGPQLEGEVAAWLLNATRPLD